VDQYRKKLRDKDNRTSKRKTFGNGPVLNQGGGRRNIQFSWFVGEGEGPQEKNFLKADTRECLETRTFGKAIQGKIGSVERGSKKL